MVGEVTHIIFNYNYYTWYKLFYRFSVIHVWEEMKLSQTL